MSSLHKNNNHEAGDLEQGFAASLPPPASPSAAAASNIPAVDTITPHDDGNKPVPPVASVSIPPAAGPELIGDVVGSASLAGVLASLDAAGNYKKTASSSNKRPPGAIKDAVGPAPPAAMLPDALDEDDNHFKKTAESTGHERGANAANADGISPLGLGTTHELSMPTPFNASTFVEDDEDGNLEKPAGRGATANLGFIHELSMPTPFNLSAFMEEDDDGNLKEPAGRGATAAAANLGFIHELSLPTPFTPSKFEDDNDIITKKKNLERESQQKQSACSGRVDPILFPPGEEDIEVGDVQYVTTGNDRVQDYITSNHRVEDEESPQINNDVVTNSRQMAVDQHGLVDNAGMEDDDNPGDSTVKPELTRVSTPRIPVAFLVEEQSDDGAEIIMATPLEPTLSWWEQRRTKMLLLCTIFAFVAALAIGLGMAFSTDDSVVISYCGCPACTDAVWDTAVTDGAGTFTCGERITFLQTGEGGSKSEYGSCKQVGDEFPSDCGPVCNPFLCNKQLEDPDPSELIWSDEFDIDGAPNPENWAFDLGDGCDIDLCNWGNNQVVYYTNSSSNVLVSNGVLRITAKKESGFSLPYTSARMVTRGLHSFKYSRIQFRANLAKCKARGTWPSLWMLPEHNVYGRWPNSGSINVMETLGHEPDKFYGTVHTVSSFESKIELMKGSDISKSKDDWHIFEINWEEDRIQFAVDKQIYFEYLREGSVDWRSWPFDQDFHLIMNVAVGGNWGGRQGINDAAFEGEGQVMDVDWVRLYGDANQPQPTKQPSLSPPSQVSYCGCNSCTQQVWDAMATNGSGSYSCGSRILRLQSAQGESEAGACGKVASDFPGICLCDPNACTETPAPTPRPTTPPNSTYCGCGSCTQAVWDRLATDASGSFSCGSRMEWLQSTQGYSERGACMKVSNEFLNNTCGPFCNTASCS